MFNVQDGVSLDVQCTRWCVSQCSMYKMVCLLMFNIQDGVSFLPLTPPPQIASGRLTHQHMDDSDIAPALKKRKVASSRIERPRGVATQFRQTDVSDVQEVTIVKTTTFNKQED